MFEIDEEMDAVLKKQAWENAIQGKAAEFKAKFPQRVALVGEEHIYEFIEYAMSKAKQYNMLADREINGLIILMHNLGCDFDIDPQYPWARLKLFPDKTFEEKEPESFLHLQKVYDQFLQFNEHTLGEDGAYLKAAQQRLRDKRLEDLRPFTDDNIVRSLRAIYPQRYDRIPEAVLRGPVMAAAHDKAFQYDLDPHAGKMVLAAMIFMHGISVNLDPLCAYMHSFLDEAPVPGWHEHQLFYRFKLLAGAILDDMKDPEEK